MATRTVPPLLMITIIASCCASVLLAQNPLYEPDVRWHAPAKAATRRNPLPPDPQMAGGGRKLFEVHCAECHQADGSGMVEKHSADLREPIVQSQSDGTLFWKITNGNLGRGMPSFSRLPEKQRWQLVLFLRTLRAHAEVSATK
jgi:mono/diheme cytochrome c family protein